MRIVAGRFKGRTLKGPSGAAVRPTSDRLRETLFNVLAGRMDGARVLDGFAGTGAVGLEALSRGAREAVFVERDRRAAGVITQNIATCGAASSAHVVHAGFGDASAELAGSGAFDLVFLDPPYDTTDLDGLVTRAASLVAPSGLVVLEHSRRRDSPPAAGGLVRTRLLVAGDSVLSFYAPGHAADTMGTLDR